MSAASPLGQPTQQAAFGPGRGPSLRHTRRLTVELHQRGLSVTDLAAHLGVSRRTLYGWASGKRQPGPRYAAVCERAAAWLEASGIDPALLFPTTPTPEAFVADVTDLDAARAARGLPPTTPLPPAAPAAPEPPVPLTTSREYLSPQDLTLFGLADDPFEDADNPEDVFLSPGLTHVENAVKRTITRRQIVAVIASPGAGKSTLIRRLYGQLGGHKRIRMVAPASIDRRRITHAALATAILRDLVGHKAAHMNQEQRSELLRTTLAAQDEAGLIPALLIDEAHLLKTDALLAIKQIWDSHLLFKQLAVILIGQEPLKAKLLSDPSVRELTGRTRLVDLPKLGEHTGDYLRWRFSRVGGDADQVFDEDAYAALATRGEYPLWVNNLAVRAMSYAASRGTTRVTATHVSRV